MKHPMQCEKCFRVCRLSDSGKTWVCTICKHREKANGGQAVSDTPRTEAEVNHQKCWSDDIVTIDANFACQLERELNEANNRIKSLIEERDRANRLADWKWNLRGEFESLLGTDNIEKGIKAVKEMKQRIKRLEEAGDYLCAAAAFMGWHDKIEDWNKAKEAKP